MIKQMQKGEYVDFSDLSPCRGTPSTSLPRNIEGQMVLLDLRVWLISNVCLQTLNLGPVLLSVHGCSDPSPPRQTFGNDGISVEDSQILAEILHRGGIRYQLSAGKSLNPKASWALTDGGLFAENFTGMMRDRDSWCHQCHSLGHSSAMYPFPSPPAKAWKTEVAQRSATTTPVICINYNTKGCSYKKFPRFHKCSTCWVKHPAKSCTTLPTDG